MRRVVEWIHDWKWPMIILCVLAIMILIDNKDEEERRKFEIEVLKQNRKFLNEHRTLEQHLKKYTDRKAADRFTGKDAKEMEARIMTNVTSIIVSKEQ